MVYETLEGQENLFQESDEDEAAKSVKLMTVEEMKQISWNVSWSGGKDSMATIIKMHELGIPISQITYIRMMYDEKTPATLPEMTEFVDKTAEVIRGWGYDLKIVPSVQTAKELAERRIMNPRKNMDRKGQQGGMSQFLRGSCRFAGVKIATIHKNTVAGYEMIGYTVDEKKRIKRLGGYKQSILAALGITQKGALEICQEYDMLSPVYKEGTTARDGCWFCPNARKRERENKKGIS